MLPEARKPNSPLAFPFQLRSCQAFETGRELEDIREEGRAGPTPAHKGQSNRRRQLCPVENNVITEFQRTKTTGSVVQQGKIGRKSDLRSLLQMAGVLGDYASG